MSALGRLHVIVDDRTVAFAALEAGAPVLQVRAKRHTDRAAFALARDVQRACDRSGAVCVVNDRADIAVAVGATGVHVGANDLPVAAARRVVGPTRLVGATARDPRTARRHVRTGASYLGVGPVYATASKDGLPEPLGPGAVEAIATSVDVPLIAIAGVTTERVAELLAAGAHGVAVLGAVGRAPDPGAATAALLDAIDAALVPGAAGRPAIAR